MPHPEFFVFGVTLFLALVALINWKRRREQIARRVNRGLRQYVSPQALAPPATGHKAVEKLIVAKGILI